MFLTLALLLQAGLQPTVVIGEPRTALPVVLRDAVVELDANAASTMKFTARNDGGAPISTFGVRVTITGEDGRPRGFKSKYFNGPIAVGEERGFEIGLSRWILDERDALTVTLMAVRVGGARSRPGP